MTVTGSLPDGFKLSVEPVRWMVFAEWEKQTVPVGSGQQNGKLSFVGMPKASPVYGEVAKIY